MAGKIKRHRGSMSFTGALSALSSACATLSLKIFSDSCFSDFPGPLPRALPVMRDSSMSSAWIDL